MTYRLLATDMDGTLLMNNKSLPRVNIEALRKARDWGMEIVICTGRPYAMVKPYLTRLGFPCWLITNNGAVIRNKEGKLMATTYIKTEILEKVIPILEEEEVYFHALDAEYTYIKNYFERIQAYQKFALKKEIPSFQSYLSAIWTVFFNNTHKKINYSTFIKSGGKIASLFVLSDDPSKLEFLKVKLQGINGIDVTSSSNNNLEVLDQEATKGHALKKLTSMLKIAPEEVVAVGDHLNDLSMIEFAGLGVAMANGEKEVIERANWITKSNEEYGISYLIEKILNTAANKVRA